MPAKMLTSALVACALSLATVAASAQDGKAEPDIRALLRDPAVTNFIGASENDWDFNKPDTIPGFGSMPTPAAKMSAACAARDLEAVIALEERGDAGDVAGDKLAGVFLLMTQARKACAADRESEALALYDSITFSSVLASGAK
jgi:hypothetical protein